MKTALLMAGVLTLMSLTSTEAKPLLDGCSHPADVAFVLDVSSSIWPKHFREHVVTFVKEVVQSLAVGAGDKDTRVGAVTFSDDVQLEFHLNNYLNKEKLLEAITKIKSRGGNTDTHEALQYVDQHIFQLHNGARSNVSRIVVVITDGAPRKTEDTVAAARTLRDHGAVVFAIGVGSKIKMQQLRDMASRPSHQFVFEVTNFEALANIKNELISKTCEVKATTTPAPTTTTTATTTTPTTTTTIPTTTTTIPTTTTPTTTTTAPTTTTTTPSTTTTPTTTTTATTTTTTPTTTTTTTFSPDISVNDEPQGDVDTVACINRPADIYFVVDSSSSIWVNDFEDRMLGFVRDVIDIFDIGSDLTRVGVITFSDTPRTVFGLNTHVDKEELLKAVNKENVKYTPGMTFTAEALQKARTNFRFEAREDVQQIIILITDGQSRDPYSTMSTARAAREDGVTLFAVGVGDGVDSGELHAVASEPSEDFVMMVENFDSLSSKKALLASRTCGASATLMPPVKPLKDDIRECDMQHADVIFAYDWNMLGGIVSTQITSTLNRVSATLEALSADVNIGAFTSSACVEHMSVSLANPLVFNKYVSSVARSQQSQIASILKTIRMTAFSAKNGHRVSARKAVVIVLDPGSISKLTQVAQEAAKIRSDDVEVFVVTSGRQGNQLVHDIVSEPTPVHVIQLPALDFSNYAYASDEIVNSLCGVNPRWYK